MNSNEANKNEKSKMETPKNEAVFFTGAALIGGAKLAYDVGKDIASKLKVNEKIFIQIIESQFIGNNHIVRCHIANAYIHGICIESIDIVDIKEDDFEVYRYDNSIGIRAPNEKREYKASFPCHLTPTEATDIYLKIKKIDFPGIMKKNGVGLTVRYNSLDSLDSFSETKILIRLIWPE